MRERPRTTLVLLICAAVLAIIAGSLLFWQSAHEKRVRTAGQQAAWQAHNAAALMSLSAARGPSAAEQARLTRAGNDPEQLRQALIEIHELRRAYAQRDLADAQRRRAELRGQGAVLLSPQETDPVGLVQQDARSAEALIASYSEALAAIRVWQPMSYPDFLAQHSVPAARSPVVAVNEPASGDRLRKVDPRVPMETSKLPAESTVASSRNQTVLKPLAPASDEVAPQNVPAPTAVETDVVDRAPRNEADVAEREQNEEAIRTTLQRWAQAMLQNDPKAESAEYAEHLDRYFLRTDVDRAFVEADKDAYLRRGNLTASFVVKDVRFENETADAVDVRLVKEVAWQRSANGVMQKAIRSRLHLIRTGTGWKISGEQDFR